MEIATLIATMASIGWFLVSLFRLVAPKSRASAKAADPIIEAIEAY